MSIVTPAFNEDKNLPLFYERLSKVMKNLNVYWEWVVVDDHSYDDTFKVVNDIAQMDNRVRGVRLARNSGSHTAITAGLHISRGDSAIVMAVDLQDPPETIPELVSKWKQGSQVVWAVRASRQGEKASAIGFSRLYYWIMRQITGLKDIPSTGADFFLVDRKVIEAIKLFKESNVSIFSLLNWIGFMQDNIVYVKHERKYGKSGWTLRKKLKLVVDSITSFSHFPVRLMTYIGFVVALMGFLFACYVIYNAFSIGMSAVPGWSSLMVVILVIAGFQMIMLGVLGEYLWRTLDESRQRPRFFIEEDTSINKD